MKNKFKVGDIIYFCKKDNNSNDIHLPEVIVEIDHNNECYITRYLCDGFETICSFVDTLEHPLNKVRQTPIYQDLLLCEIDD